MTFKCYCCVYAYIYKYFCCFCCCCFQHLLGDSRWRYCCCGLHLTFRFWFGSTISYTHFTFWILICMCVAISFQCQSFDCVVATRRFFFSLLLPSIHFFSDLIFAQWLRLKEFLVFFYFFFQCLKMNVPNRESCMCVCECVIFRRSPYTVTDMHTNQWSLIVLVIWIRWILLSIPKKKKK